MIVIILVSIIVFIPVIGEIFFDKWRWAKGKDDKPLSTYLRSAAFIVLAIPMAFMQGEVFWLAYLISIVFLFFNHLMFFNLTLNIARPNVKWNYRKEGEWLTEHIPNIWLELAGKWVLYYCGWAAYFHWDWVCCGAYPLTFFEYFKY